MSKTLFYKEEIFKKWKNKSYCIQVELNDNTGFSFDLSWTKNCDHAGFSFTLDLFGFFTYITIADTRHWDYENKCWEKYE